MVRHTDEGLMRIALVQMSIGSQSNAGNVAKTCDCIDEAARERPDMIVLSQLFNTGHFCMSRDFHSFDRAQRERHQKQGAPAQDQHRRPDLRRSCAGTLLQHGDFRRPVGGHPRQVSQDTSGGPAQSEEAVLSQQHEDSAV